MSAAKTFSAWLEAFNDPDPAALEGFAVERSDVAGAADLWAAYQRSIAPLRLLKTDAIHTRVAKALVQDRWDHCFELTLSVTAEQPMRVSAMEALPIPPPEHLRPERMDWPRVREALEARLADHAARGWFSGAVVVARRGERLFEAVHSEADREAGIANNFDTRFRMGSMNKMITGVAALQLVQSGALGLGDPVGRHLPDYPNRGFAERVRIRHLLNHTGGAGDFFGKAFREHRLELRDPADYVALLGDREPEFEPGSQYRYANYGFILLGRIIEAASGRTYDDYCVEHVFAPAGMSATGALPESVEVPGRAVGYMQSREGLVRNDATLPFRGTPAGGGYSTVGDLLRFAEALTAGKLLSAEHMQYVASGGFEVADGETYGAGFLKQSHGGVRSYGHTGGAPGMNGTLLIYPDTGYVIAALSNGDPPQASSLGEFIGDRLQAA